MDPDRDALHAFYLACAYGMVALAVIVELLAVRRSRRRARQVAAAFDDPEPVTHRSTPDGRNSDEIPA